MDSMADLRAPGALDSPDAFLRGPAESIGAAFGVPLATSFEIVG